ncbi:MAG: ATP-binding protein [Archaeoglobaceae archaeon]
MNVVGLVFGKSSISEFSFVVNPQLMPRFGEYVVAKNNEGEEVLGIVREISSFNRLIVDEFGFDYMLKNLAASRSLLERNEVVVANASVVGVMRDGFVEPNRSPVKPSSEVRIADDEMLRRLFSPTRSSIEIGRLLTREDVAVSLDVNQLVLRHFAILSVTGGGKSNTVAVIVNDVVRKLKGTVVLIDPHGEYVGYTFEDGTELGKNIVPAGIRPERLEPWEFASLVGVDRERAAVQRMHLERAFTTVRAMGLSGRDFVEAVLDRIEEWINAASQRREVEYYDVNGARRIATLDRQDLSSLGRIKEYVSSFLRRYEDLLQQRDMLASIKPSYLNVVDLSGFDEMQMRVVVAYLLRNLLTGRINYLRGRRGWESVCPAVRKPVLLIFEEAHIFASKDYNDVTLWMGRIAREGRKFGIGMGIVSQRPKKINEDILSQCNTKIVLRIVEPSDQRYIQQASESISEDLLKDIASLGVGEAVIVGPAVKLPVAVKIRRFTGSYGGGDRNVVEEWSEEDFSLEELAV